MKVTETKIGSTAHVLATAGQRRCAMSKSLTVIYYNAAMAIFRKWFAAGIINESELAKIETFIAEKYGLSSCSIYRKNA